MRVRGSQLQTTTAVDSSPKGKSKNLSNTGWRLRERLIWSTAVFFYLEKHASFKHKSLETWGADDVRALADVPRSESHTWEVGDGLVHGDGGEGGPGQRQVGGPVVLLGLQVGGLWHTGLQTNIRGGAERGGEETHGNHTTNKYMCILFTAGF